MYKKIILMLGLFVSSEIICAEQITTKELIVGIFPRHDFTDTIRMFTPLINYLNKKNKI